MPFSHSAPQQHAPSKRRVCSKSKAASITIVVAGLPAGLRGSSEPEQLQRYWSCLHRLNTANGKLFLQLVTPLLSRRKVTAFKCFRQCRSNRIQIHIRRNRVFFQQSNCSVSRLPEFGSFRLARSRPLSSLFARRRTLLLLYGRVGQCSDSATASSRKQRRTVRFMTCTIAISSAANTSTRAKRPWINSERAF